MKRLLQSWIWRVPVEDEVNEEVAFHLEMRAREFESLRAWRPMPRGRRLVNASATSDV